MRSILFKTAILTKKSFNIRSRNGYLIEENGKLSKTKHPGIWYKGRFAAPSQSELQDLLRKRGVHISVKIDIETDKYECLLVKDKETHFYQDGYKSWEDALEDGLVQGLEIYHSHILKEISNKTNRSKNQTKYLFELLEADHHGSNLEKLIQLETNIKNCHINYCPGNLESTKEVLKMTPKSIWWDELKSI